MEKKFWTLLPKEDTYFDESDYFIGHTPRKENRKKAYTAYSTYDAAVAEAKKKVQEGGDYLVMEVVAAVKQPIPPAEVVLVTA